MKKYLILASILVFFIPVELIGQENGASRVARISYSSAERNYNNGRYQDALQEFMIVVNTIPVDIDSRRHLEMRMESLNYIIEICFYKHVNIERGCKYLELFLNNMDVFRNSEVFRPSQQMNLLRQEQEYIADYIPRCENYRDSDENINQFRQLFDEEFE